MTIRTSVPKEKILPLLPIHSEILENDTCDESKIAMRIRSSAEAAEILKNQSLMSCIDGLLIEEETLHDILSRFYHGK